MNGLVNIMRISNDIETSRLKLRSYLRSDKDFCISLWCDEENGRFLSDPVIANADENYLSAFDDMEDDSSGYYLIAELKKENGSEPVGTCCIFPEKGGNYDIGYCISKKYWKQGLGTELLGAIIKLVASFGGTSITAEIADDNIASIELASKFGFRPDKKKSFKKWRGEIEFDSYVYKLKFNVWNYGSSKEICERQLDNTIKGIKRATTSSVWGYEFRQKDLPEMGSVAVITNWEGVPSCIIRTVNIMIIPFENISQEIVSMDGPDITYEEWMSTRRAFFEEEGMREGYSFTEDMPLVIEEFEVVAVV